MKKNITVYTTSHCSYCTMLKGFLSQNNIPFNEINVEKDPIMMEELVKQTGQMGVPQTDINGKWVIGFDSKRIMDAIKQ